MNELQFTTEILNRPGTAGRSSVDRLLLNREVDEASGCWLWQGKINHGGYGVTSVFGRHALAHRVAYMAFVGPIAPGLHLDHLCRNPPCCNPEHLEPVTPQVNKIRAVPFLSPRPQRERCKQLHEMTPENTYTDGIGYTHCRECRRLSNAKHYEQRKIKRALARSAR